MYKLFLGYRKLGEFPSISEAKKYAHEMNTVGVFTLTDNRYYYDSWYVSESDIKNGMIERAEI